MAEVIGTAEYRLTADTSGLEKGINQAKSIVASGSSEIASSTEASGGKISKLSTGAIAAASLVGSAVFKAFNAVTSAISSSLDSAINRVDTINNFQPVMESLGFSAEEAASSIDLISNSLDGLPTSLDAMVGNVQKLSATMGNLNDGAVNATTVGLALNNMLLAGGKGAQAAANAFEQYNQMLAVGKVDQQAWNSLVNAAPGQMRQMAQALLGAEANAQDLYAAMKDGIVTFDDFNAAVVSINAEGGESFESFEDQARAATGGIGTAIENVQNRINKAVGSVIDAIGQANISGAINSFSSQFGKLGDAVAAAITGEGDAQKLVKEFVDGIGKALKTTLPQLGKIIGEIVPILVEAVVGLIPSLVEGLLGALSELLIALAEAIPNMVDVLIDAILTTIDILFSPEVFDKLLQAAIKFLMAIVEAIPTIVTAMVQALPTIINTVLNALLNPNTLSMLLDAAIQLLMALVEAIPTIITALAEALPQIITSIISFLTDPQTILLLVNAAVQLFFGLVQAVPQILGALIGAFGTLVGNLWEGIKKMFGEFAGKFGDFIGGIFKGALNGVLAFIEGFINTPINLINGFIGLINGAFGWIGVNLGYLNTVQLPRLYTGGIVEDRRGGTPIIAGDGGEDEFVVPESKMASLIQKIEEQGGTGGGDTLNFNFNGIMGTPSELREAAILFHDKYEEVRKARFQND